jgi:histidine kinase
MKIADYQITETLSKGKHFSIYRAREKNRSTSVVLKVQAKESLRNNDMRRSLKREFRYLQSVNSPYVVKARKRFMYHGASVLLLEDIDWVPLKDVIAGKSLPIDKFLEIAVKVSLGLAAVHRRNIVHKDMNPANIIVGSRWQRVVKIISFDTAATYDARVAYTGNPEGLVGTLPYISPEQTGRMNRKVDRRSDLYSLGATFYEMLTGRTPFPECSPLEMVYNHLAREPEPPHKLNPDIPAVLSVIILKLLAKNPEERYQSAEGLIYDLEIFRSRKHLDFKLGVKDFSGKLQIPERLYGRQKEIQLLLDAYRRLGSGKRELIMVTGAPGTGKSALVNEIHKLIAGERGYFISGKFDQLQRKIPYSAITQAFNQLCQLLLAEPQEELSRWKELVQKAVGKLGKVLTDMIPMLEAIIGTQPPVTPLGGRETQKRFNYVFLRFLSFISSEDHPLVLFIDDWQWADIASLDLLQRIIEDEAGQYIFCIGAYRDNEVTGAHPLTVTLEEMEKQRIHIHTLPLKNLSRENVNEWLWDTVSGTYSDSEPGGELKALTRLIYGKTQGNAFFTIQFLQNLYAKQLLCFDFTRNRWTWDVEEIEKQNITDNVVDMLVIKIQTLPSTTQEALKLAACIGNVFHLGTLSVISAKTVDWLEKVLETALIEQLVYPLDNRQYKFIHDRVHQATYLLIAPGEKKVQHLKIGRLLLDNLREFNGTMGVGEFERRAFDVANHLNIGISLMEDETERIDLARLNLEVAQAAKNSGAYKSADDYIHNAVSLLPTRCWQQHYRLTLAIYEEALQTSSLCGNFEVMDVYIDGVLQEAHSISDTAVAYEYRLYGLLLRTRPQQAVETMLAIFRRLGVDVPNKPTKLQTKRLLEQIDERLDTHRIARLKDLPPMTDPQIELVIRLYYQGISALSFAGQDLSTYLAARMVGLIMDYGITPETPYVLCSYATKKLKSGDIPACYHLGETALQMLESGIGDDTVKFRSIGAVCFYLQGNKRHFKRICRLMLDMYQRTLEVGDLQFVGYMVTNYIMCLSRTDTPLPQLYKKALDMRETVIKVKQEITVIPLQFEIAAADALLGKTENPAILAIDQERLFTGMHQTTVRLFRWQLNTKRTILALMFEDYDRIAEYVAAAEEDWRQITSPITYIKSDFYFYIPLAHMRMLSNSPENNDTPKNKKGANQGKKGKKGKKGDRQKILSRIREYIRMMKEWADFGPVNFLHKYYLLQAEYCRITGKHAGAREFYEKAVEKAYDNNYINDAAVANQLAANYYLSLHQSKVAAVYLVEARSCYHKWGAAANVKYLNERYPKYLTLGVSRLPQSNGEFLPGSPERTLEFIDAKSILNASQALSGEVHLKKLLESMVQILIKNAGAQKCLFIQEIDGGLAIQAEGSVEGVSTVMKEIPVEQSGKVPLAVLNYVARSKQPQVFDNLSGDPRYATDPYVQSRQPKSAVCFPVLRKGQLSALIYLENNGIEGVFTPSRLEVLSILSSQISISVENTQLYETLEEKVRKRTVALRQAHRELEQKHEELERSHKNINDSVYYASRIQDAVLPSPELFETLVPEYFIMYRPCSVLGGDFYWIKQIDDKIVVAVADCTGHGVPGALLSMLGVAFLNEITPQLAHRSELTSNGLLDKLREQVKTALRQQEGRSVQKEGMDIALCIIDPKNLEIQHAGAYNPLYRVRDRRLTELKGDRMPIGVYRRERPFSSKKMSYRKGDMLYLFTDGYPDQNAENNDIKFTKKAFKKLLVEISPEPVSKQEDILNRRFDEWKGSEPQRDDVLVLGIRL